MPTFPVGPASRARGMTRPSSLAGLQCLSRRREKARAGKIIILFAGGAEAGAGHMTIEWGSVGGREIEADILSYN